jgi:hypothetical protein
METQATRDMFDRPVSRPLSPQSDRAVAQVLPIHGRVFTEVAPSGVKVVSGVPLMETRWWDHTVLHFVWSWTSWTAQILNTYGHPGLKRWFNAHWTREGHPEPVKTDWKAWKKENGQ